MEHRNIQFFGISDLDTLNQLKLCKTLDFEAITWTAVPPNSMIIGFKANDGGSPVMHSFGLAKMEDGPEKMQFKVQPTKNILITSIVSQRIEVYNTLGKLLFSLIPPN